MPKMEFFYISLKQRGNAKTSNINIIVPSFNTARIQESHIFLGHFIFEQKT